MNNENRPFNPGERVLFDGSLQKIVYLKEEGHVIKYFLPENPDYIRDFKDECEVLRRCRHSNIVSYFGTVKRPQLGILMEYCENGPLENVVFDPSNHYEMETILKWMKQLFRALCHLCEKKIAHTNINLHNILVTENLDTKLTGFGCALRDNELEKFSLAASTDLYSVGVVSWHIVERKDQPFEDQRIFGKQSFQAKISESSKTFQVDPSFYDKFEALIESCTAFETCKRTNCFSALLIIKDLQDQHAEWLKSRKDDNTQNPSINQRPIFEKSGNTVMPINYEPDLDDKHFRDERIPKDCFHELARGSQAIVIAATLVRKMGQKDEPREKVAAKRFDIAELKRNSEQSDEYQGFTFLLRELQNSQYLVHPNIVEMKDSFYESFPNGRPGYVWLVTERMDSSLEYYFDLSARQDNDQKNRPILRDHRHLASLLVQLLRALDFLHSQGIMHRDVTPKNIGLNRKDFVVKLLDFGVSGQKNSQGAHTEIVSTPLIYQPLEVILQRGYDCGGGGIGNQTLLCYLVDVWAVGLIAFGMLGTKLMYPTDKEKLDGVKQRILDVVGLPSDKYAAIFEESLVKEACRPSTLNQEFDRAFSRLKTDCDMMNQINLRDLLEKLLSVNPQKRAKPSVCLEHPYLRSMNVCFSEPKGYIPNRNSLPTADEMKEKNERDEDRLTQLLEKFSRKLEVIGE